jgi:hypothetical protein
MGRRCRLTAALLLAIAAGGPATAKPLRHPRVPSRFVGMVVDSPTWPDKSVNLAHQLKLMVATGVQSLHVVFDWAQSQPYASWDQVPAADRGRFRDVTGVPTDFSALDRLVTLTAECRLTLLPEVVDAPGWDGDSYRGAVVQLPRTPEPYAAFLAALVRRYGPGGTFWPANPSVPRTPITMWQIWNEPNLVTFWPRQPFAARYVALLRAAHDAIKSVDPQAQVVLGGLTNYSWLDLGQIYQVPGARSLFDVVAVHPYTRAPDGVITILGYVRHVMNQAGDDRKPLLADEVGWPSALGKTRLAPNQDFATTEAGQAANVAALLPLLAQARRRLGLRAFYYYNWAGFERQGGFLFQFSGLFRFRHGRFLTKPAFTAFRAAALSIEGCCRR